MGPHDAHALVPRRTVTVIRSLPALIATLAAITPFAIPTDAQAGVTPGRAPKTVKAGKTAKVKVDTLVA